MSRTSFKLPALLTVLLTSACGESTPPPAAGASKPVIASFTAAPAKITSDQGTTLSWSVSGAQTVSINQGVGIVTGSSVAVTPTATTTYTLTATNPAGNT